MRLSSDHTSVIIVVVFVVVIIIVSLMMHTESIAVFCSFGTYDVAVKYENILLYSYTGRSC